MLAAVDAQLLAVLIFGWLAASLAYGRPPSPWARSSGELSAESETGSKGQEILWLGSLGSVFVYPLVVLFFPSHVLAGPLTLRFPGDELVQLLGLALILVGGGLVGWAFARWVFLRRFGSNCPTTTPWSGSVRILGSATRCTRRTSSSAWGSALRF